MTQTIVSIEHLKKSYGDLEVLSDINLNIQAGEIYGLIGMSGAGKSTLLRTINGLTNFQEGKLFVDGQDITSLDADQIRELRKDIGMIFQNFSLVNRLTVRENIALPMTLWKMDQEQIDQRVRDLAQMVGIEEKLDQYPRQLSGGQKQRVGIARALSLEPKILLSDEATSALDPMTTQQILDLLVKINKELGITIIVVTHEIEVVKAICHKTAVLDHGRIILNDDTKKLFLTKPEELQRIISQRLVYEKTPGQTLLKLNFYEYEGYDSLLSDLSLTTQVPFRTRDIQVEKINDSDTAFYVLEVADADVEKLAAYLDQKGIHWEVLA